MTLTATTKDDLMKQATQLSAQHPNKVLIVSTVFGQHDPMFFSRVPRLGPDSTRLGGFFKNGKFHSFTADQLHRCEVAGDLVTD